MIGPDSGGIGPEGGESLSPQISGEKMEQLIADLRDASQAKRRLEDQRKNAGANVDSAVLKAYSEVNRRFQEVLKELKDSEAQLKVEGWITSKEGGFKVDLTESRSGNKIFKVVDVYGRVPVTEGQAFQAKLDAQNAIPEAIRGSIINQFTFGEGGVAKDRYSDIPEGDNFQIDPQASEVAEKPKQPTEPEEPVEEAA